MRTFKYRIYPTKKQASILNKQLEVCRLLYNSMLESKKNAWETEKKNLSGFDLIKTIPARKKDNKDLKLVYADVLQNLGLRLEKAYKGFFSRVKKGEKPGFPRFKGVGRLRSMIFPRWGSGIKFKDGKLSISKVGNIKIKVHRPIEGITKTATVIKTGDDWYISIVCDGTINKTLPKTGNVIAIDLGIKSYITDNKGNKVENPRFFEWGQKALAKQQRQKNKKAARKVYKKISNRREDFIHKLSLKLIRENDIIILEDLNVNKMLVKRWCSKQIGDASWSTFTQVLEYKAESAGKQVIKVNPAYTSQTCSNCHTATPHELKDDIFKCDFCHHQEDRDINAAKNIMTLGLQSLEFPRSPDL